MYAHFAVVNAIAILLAVFSGPQSASAATNADIRLKSIYAESHSLDDLFSEGERFVVLVFLDTGCPVVSSYLPRLQEMHERYRGSNVAMFGVFANAATNCREMAIYAHDRDLPFPVFLDIGYALADKLEVRMTPEVVLLDRQRNKLYQGAIDNQFKRGGRLPEPTENYLQDAIEAALAGQPVETPHRPASGCALQRRERPSASKELTYHRDVAPILQHRCQSCHRSGGVAPFGLLSYDDAYDNVDRIAEAVEDRRMPPWHGELNPAFGELANDKRMSDDEIGAILDWVDHGAPEGDPQQAPPKLAWPSSEEWEIGRPDFVYKMPSPFRLPKDGQLEYQFFRVPLGFPTDRWYQAIQVRPGNSEVVHHVAVHIVPAGDKRYQGLTAMAQLYGFNAQQGNVIADYVPGDTHNAKTFDAGQAARIPKNSDLVFELHYTPNGRAATTDQSEVAFRWAETAPEREVLGRVFRKPVGRFRIPPRDHHYPMVDSYYFETDIDLDAVRPHFHLRGKSYRLELVERDEVTDGIVNRETILAVPLYDQNWQRMYEFSKPLRIPAGAELLATVNFDNSRFNPSNPDPNVEVVWGQQTTDEMFSTRFRYRLPSEATE